jgi:hypothetical protein
MLKPKINSFPVVAVSDTVGNTFLDSKLCNLYRILAIQTHNGTKRRVLLSGVNITPKHLYSINHKSKRFIGYGKNGDYLFSHLADRSLISLYKVPGP